MLYNDLAARFDLFLFDMDGTLIMGDEALPGAAEFLAALRRDGKAVYFVTNNTMHPVTHHAHRLQQAGICASEADILTPLPGLLDYIVAQNFRNPFVIASDEVKVAISNIVPRLERGSIVNKNGSPNKSGIFDEDCVILSLCRNWDYEQLQTACNLALAGKPFILAQPDPYCPDPAGNIPDSGALLALIETTICRKIDNVTVIGKPSPALIAPVVKDLSRTIFFGDRLFTDMKLADNAGITGAVVLTGQTKRRDITADMPYIILNDLTGLA